jgi:hypothetical protein
VGTLSRFFNESGSKKLDYLSSRWYLENKLRIKISGTNVDNGHINIFGGSD